MTTFDRREQAFENQFEHDEELKFKARARKTAWSRLPKSPLPAIAALKDGGFMFLGKAARTRCSCSRRRRRDRH